MTVGCAGEIEHLIPSTLFPSSASKRQVKQRPRKMGAIGTLPKAEICER